MKSESKKTNLYVNELYIYIYIIYRVRDLGNIYILYIYIL